MKKSYLNEWYKKRGIRFIWQRLISLLTRYSLFSGKITKPINTCVAILAEFDCEPTFFVPAVILKKYPKFILKLKDAGCEIAVHGYHHIDLRQIPIEQACGTLELAAQTFENHGIKARGFRVPYLGCNEDLLKAIPSKLFNYSSNIAINWDYNSTLNKRSEFSNTLRRIYLAKSSQETICIPWKHFDFVEIPVCLPDDLDLHDGFCLGPEEIAQFWCQLLHKIHARGELFTLLVHSELAFVYAQPLKIFFQEIQRLQSSVWLAKLSEISDWWIEKTNFEVKIENGADNLHITFNCSPLATILTRGVDLNGNQQAWDERYSRLYAKDIRLAPGPRPFIGVSPTTSEQIISFLHNQGYILDTSELANQCATYINHTILSGLNTELQLVNYIEASNGPLIKFGHWPDGAKSALNVTGDLDAITLLDYATRLWLKF